MDIKSFCQRIKEIFEKKLGPPIIINNIDSLVVNEDLFKVKYAEWENENVYALIEIIISSNNSQSNSFIENGVDFSIAEKFRWEWWTATLFVTSKLLQNENYLRDLELESDNIFK
jgi:hypothetical protein